MLKGIARKKIQSLCLLAGALLFLSLMGCAQNPVTGEHDFVMLSEDSEIAIGRTNHPKIIKQYGRYDDETLQDYVQKVGDKLAAVSHRNELIYRFTVLDSPVINAFALPGGYIYITRGLMAYLNSEAELAAVLGHEIGHVTARHGVRQQSAAQAAGLGYLIGSILFPELRAAPSQQLYNILGGALLSGYGREHELESDGLGAEYLARAGYDPKAMIEVIRVLKDQEIFAAAQAKKQGREIESYHGLFASHPDNDTRLHEVVATAEAFSKGQKGKVLRASYLDQINGLAFGDSEEQGIRSGRHFYHLPMKFSLSFPDGWQINNKADSLQAISENGQAFIEMGAMDLNRKLSPQVFIIERLNIDNLKVGRSLNIGGLDGYTGLFDTGDKIVRVAVVYLKKQAFVFFASSKKRKEFSQFDPDFLVTIKSLHTLKIQEYYLAKAQEVETVTVIKQDNYQTWAKASRISNSPLMALRLLNGHYPNGELELGQKVKRIK
ncbi:MAG: M48 family metalloprotease [Piscirickettsiaceae bacterium]|nr:M48 family metalloprotease [Piscirickettsiaceae bacterium]